MKKSLKLLAVGGMLLPCALVFTACGGNGQFSDAQVDTKGTYTETTSTEVSSFVSNQNFNADFSSANGYKMSYSVTMTGLSFDGVVICTLDDDGDINGLAMKGDYIVNTGAYEAETKLEAYAPNDGFFYVDTSVGGKQYKYKVEVDSFDDAMERFAVDEFDFEGFFEASIGDSGVTIKQAIDGDLTKYEITSNELLEGYEDVKSYLVFDEFNLVGATFEGSMATSEMSMDYNIQAQSYDKSISYPNFDGYTLLNN